VTGGALAVRGGAHSISADFEGLRQLAAQLDGAVDQLGTAMLTMVRAAIDPSVVAAALLDPAGALEVAEVAARAVTAAAIAIACCEALATGLRVAAASYQTVDDLAGQLTPIGSALTNLTPALAAGSWNIGIGLVTGDSRRIEKGLLTTAEQDPQLVAPVVDMLAAALAPNPLLLAVPSPIAGFAGAGRTHSQIAMSTSALGAIYRDGRPVLTRRPGDRTTDAAGPPRTVADLMLGLSCRDENTTGGGVDLRFVTVTRADGSVGRSVIVDITGSKDWSITKRGNLNVANPGTNLTALGNHVTSYELGVLKALKASGVRADEPIMLVGHSQGGIIAARLAADLRNSRDFKVTHLLTAGAPVGLIDVPPQVQVLSLENRRDVVPELDAAENLRRSNWTTVTVDRGGTGLGERHYLRTAYLPGAADVDASDDPSVRAWVRSAGSFLAGGQVTTSVYQVSRRP
jgi:hypothetical protein